MGIITDSVKRYVPASYHALVGITNSYDYTLDDLQTLAEFVQFRFYGTIAGITAESSVWNPLQSEFLGVVTTLEFIPAAVDYWGDQLASESTSPTSESVSYFDRRADLWKVYDKLVIKAGQLGTELGISTTKIRGSVPSVSYGDNGRGVLLTPDPQDFPPAFVPNNSTDYISWESLGWNAGDSWESEA
jgi:hypothetical protein